MIQNCLKQRFEHTSQLLRFCHFQLGFKSFSFSVLPMTVCPQLLQTDTIEKPAVCVIYPYCSRSKSLHDRAVINCQYSMATFSTAERKRRPHGDRKSSEMSLHLKQTFEAAVLTELYPRSQIDIYVKILQADGGNYSACVNAATLALVDAGIPMRDYVCACTAGFVEDTPLADLCHAEESGGGTSLALALLPRSGNIALLQMDARLHQDHLDALIEAAMTACKGLSKVLDGVVRQHLEEVSVLTRD
uniref:Putative exosome complex component RRP41 n=1 Tax=Sinocyclocheilus grahami TaxID=75366 RepID=A0A672KLJ8_SINGR